MEYYEEDIDSGADFEEDPLEESEELIDEGLFEDVEVEDSTSNVPTVATEQTTLIPSSSDMPSGKDIAQVVGDLLQSKIFGDVNPDESLAKMMKETVENSDRLREEFEAKLRNIPLNKTEDYILNGQLYGDLASRALDANDQRIKTLNAISKFMPKAAPKAQVNVAQQMNNQQSVHNGVSPEQFIEVIRATEDAGLNPIARIRDAEEDAADIVRRTDEEEGEEESEDFSSTGSENDAAIFSPSVDDFGA